MTLIQNEAAFFKSAFVIKCVKHLLFKNTFRLLPKELNFATILFKLKNIPKENVHLYINIQYNNIYFFFVI